MLKNRAHLLAWPLVAIVVAGCSRPQYDTSTPERALDAMQSMVEDGNSEQLPELLHIEPREMTFEDGVTEASAIEDVREKLGDMLGQLWRVATKLQERFPDEVSTEASDADFSLLGAGYGEWFGPVLADPFGVLQSQRARMTTEDFYDGTAALLLDDEPIYGGLLSMIETNDGWRISIPVSYLHSNEYWPQTRQEWSVIASMLLGVENSLSDFETEVDRGDFKTLSMASERAGRLLGESVIVQSVIYGMMKRPNDA